MRSKTVAWRPVCLVLKRVADVTISPACAQQALDVSFVPAFHVTVFDLLKHELAAMTEHCSRDTIQGSSQ